MSISSVFTIASSAISLLGQLPTVFSLVSELVEQAESKNLTGTEKLAGVLAALKAFVTTIAGDDGSTFDKVQSVLTGIINAVVAMKNAMGWGSDDDTASSTATTATTAG